MRPIALALISVLALGACNPSAPAGGQGQSADAGSASGGGLFPSLTQASYRAEATLMHDGKSMPIVMIRDGRNMRLEMSTDQGQSTIISNGETGEGIIITNAQGRTMAMRTNALSDQIQNPADAWSGDLASTATRTGACSGAGQSGSEWTRTGDGGEKTVCVTNDGIILNATDGGQTVWETTSVQRGAQSADLFAAPPGVQVMDLNNIPGIAEALERAKAARGGN